jgi:predicted lipid-binding transport protein (Tim44 family)
MSGLMGGIMGFALGGLLGSLLFGGLGGGLFGGIGLVEILLIGGLLYVVFAYLRRRQQPTPASPYGYAPPQGAETPSWQSESMYTAPAPLAVTESDRERGIRHIRQMESTFDPVRFTATAAEVFCQVQAAWMGRDLEPVRPLMTPEMYEQMHKDCDRLRVERRINRLENLAVRSTEVTEAWQENGQDFVTVRVLASLVDYTVEESTHRVLEGSNTELVQCEEYWTFTRPVGPHPWQLGAIQQAA